MVQRAGGWDLAQPGGAGKGGGRYKGLCNASPWQTKRGDGKCGLNNPCNAWRSRAGRGTGQQKDLLERAKPLFFPSSILGRHGSLPR